jgi:hypothetical protein
MCGRLDEDGCHLLFKCKQVRKVWMELNIEHVNHKLTSVGLAREMMETVLTLREGIANCDAMVVVGTAK